jgi:sporulation protein YlmC with PRC-barrel domain
MFWDMHDALFENQRRLSLATIFMIGAGLGLPQPAMRNALETGQYKNKVRNDFMGGIRSASTAHPPFLSTVGDMTALMTTPPWCRQSRCASPPMRMTNQASTRPINVTFRKTLFELTMVSAALASGIITKAALKPQERTMVAFTESRTPLKRYTGATYVLPNSSRRGWIIGTIGTALAVVLAAGPALTQAGVALVKVDLSVVAKGYRMSKIIGSNVTNDKNEKIGTIDDVIADKKQLNFAVLQVGGFLGMGGHLVVVPYESLTIDDTGKKIVLPGASKEELKKLNEYKYPVS